MSGVRFAVSLLVSGACQALDVYGAADPRFQHEWMSQVAGFGARHVQKVVPAHSVEADKFYLEALAPLGVTLHL